ncbi:MAG: type II toxin-antitoxin system RelB/DinJ family antitoxin [Clostridiales Family XIII bacterium]|jgi:DNA-damage-inducible protein J|nr:type II toxin-antitoxin system RelB/DinJ family antitoxin [Clostridiales Family XIII bacterium]
MAQTTVNIRMDEELKKQSERLFNEFGMNMTTAFTVFAKAVVRTGKIPFEISVKLDDFYNEHNQKKLRESAIQRENGDVIVKTMEELVANE